MEQLWINPSPQAAVAGDGALYGEFKYGERVYGSPTRIASNLDTRFVRVASELAPTQSPAPAGHAIVPEGWVRQMGDEGEEDMGLVDARTTPATPAATMSQFTVPYYTGGWPPDPLIGQPGHTKPTQ